MDLSYHGHVGLFFGGSCLFAAQWASSSGGNRLRCRAVSTPCPLESAPRPPCGRRTSRAGADRAVLQAATLLVDGGSPGQAPSHAAGAGRWAPATQWPPRRCGRTGDTRAVLRVVATRPCGGQLCRVAGCDAVDGEGAPLPGCHPRRRGQAVSTSLSRAAALTVVWTPTAPCGRLRRCGRTGSAPAGRLAAPLLLGHGRPLPTGVRAAADVRMPHGPCGRRP